MKQKTLYLTRAALIAALYVVLTLLSQIFGLASGVIQFRLSEALTVMPLLYKESIIGLCIGCFVANIITGCAAWDVIFGATATCLGALGTYYIGRKIPVLGPVFPILSNMLIVPPVLMYVYGAKQAYWVLLLGVGIGEIACAGFLGWYVYTKIKKTGVQ